MIFFFFSSRRRHTRSLRDWSSDVCSSDLVRHLGILAIVLLAAAACSRSTPPGQQVRVSLRDFHVGTSAATIPGGTVTFDVSSRGPTTHEFVVVRTDLSAGALPIGPDGITVDEESPRLGHVG